MQPDPLGFGDGLNLYAYVGNDPLNFVDPTGLLARETASKAKQLYTSGALQLALDGAALSETPAVSQVAGIASGIISLAQGDFAGAGLSVLGAVPVLGIAADTIKTTRSASKFADGGTTTLYRAVGPDELADIRETGQLINRGSAEGKYFTTSAEGASAYAKQAVSAFGDAPYTTVKTTIPTSSLPSPTNVDRGIPAFVVPDNALPGLTPSVLNSMVLPR